jgi:hypothetical protein
MPELQSVMALVKKQAKAGLEELERELLGAVEAMELEFVASEPEFATDLGGGQVVPLLAYDESEEQGATPETSCCRDCMLAYAGVC